MFPPKKINSIGAIGGFEGIATSSAMNKFSLALTKTER
jgi:hypothetical protein